MVPARNPARLRALAVALVALATVLALAGPAAADEIAKAQPISNFWFFFGLSGNVVFGSRFLYQWYVSEKAGKSTIPVAFWYLSMAGSLIFLVFSIHLYFEVGWRDATPIFLGYAFNTVPYARNLMLIKKEQQSRASEGAPGGPGPVGPGSPENVEAARS